MKEVSLQPEPKGYRDIYWCWRLNEPFFSEWPVNEGVRQLRCPNCNCFVVPERVIDAAAGAIEDEAHEFLGHLKVIKNVASPERSVIQVIEEKL